MGIVTDLDVWQGRACFNAHLAFDAPQDRAVLQPGRGASARIQVVEMLFASGDEPLTFRLVDSASGLQRWQEALQPHDSQHRSLTIPLRLESGGHLLLTTSGPSKGSFCAANGIYKN